MNIEERVSYRELLENLSDGVYFTDRERQILFWNRGAEAITGYAAADVVGKHCWNNILAHVDMDGHPLCTTTRCPLVQAIETGQPRVTEAFLRHKGGYRVPVLIRTMPIRDEAGAIIGAVETFNDNSASLAARRTIQKLEGQALMDALTGLFNRRHLEGALNSRFEEFRRYGAALGVILFDVDDFKQINDAHGHDAGDEALRVVAHNLTANARAADTPGRWGGDEFMVIAERVDAAGLQAIAERYRFLIEHSRVGSGAGQFHFTVSMGATLAKPDDTPEGLVRRADELMYQSKSSGRNRVTMG